MESDLHVIECSALTLYLSDRAAIFTYLQHQAPYLTALLNPTLALLNRNPIYIS
jgi:hypothetical protein